jgi:hypothetical protein
VVKVELTKTFDIPVPAGYEPVMENGKPLFREPKNGELYIPINGSGKYCNTVKTSCGHEPEHYRLIVRKSWEWPKELGPEGPVRL